MRNIIILTFLFTIFNYFGFSQSTDSLVHELTKKAIQSLEAGKAKMGLEYGEQSLQLASEKMPEADSIHATIRSILGYAYLDNFNYDESLIHFQKALDIRVALYGENSMAVVKSYNNLGNFYYLTDVYNKSIGFYKRAIGICEKKIDEREKIFLGELYINIASSFEELGEHEKAILFSKKGLQINRKALGGNHVEVAKNYINLGINYFSLKKYDKSLVCFQKSNAISDSIKIEKDHPLRINYYSNLGKQFLYSNKFSLAIENYHKQLIACKSRYGKNHPEVAIAYSDLANAYNFSLTQFYTEEKFKQALYFYKKALKVFLNNLDEYHPNVKRIYTGLGELYFNKKSYTTAIEYLEKAKKTKANHNTDAILYAENYLDIYNLEAKTRYSIYKQTENLNELEKAKEAVRKTIKLIDLVKRNYTEANSKQILLESNYEIFETGIDINFRLWEENKDSSYLYEAFFLSEKSKNNLLLEAFHKSRAEEIAGIPDSLLEASQLLQNKITLYEKILFKEEQKEKNDQDRITRINNKLFRVKNDYEELIRKIESEFPKYYKLKYEINIPSVRDIQKEVLEPAEGVIEYFVGDSSIYIFIIDKREFSVHKIKNNFSLDKFVQKFYGGASKYNFLDRVTIDSLEDDYIESAQFIYKKIFEPYSEFIPPRIIIIPDGVLAYLPFESLLMEKPNNKIEFRSHAYLLREYIISYSYSAGLLFNDEEKVGKANKGTLLGFAPSFKDTSLYLLKEARDLNLCPLKYNIDEVEQIFKLTDGALFVGNAATENNFINEAGHYNILHLATHGEANDQLSEYSYLAFTEIEDSIENELLYIKDVYNLKLNAEMVVLSACQTGFGEIRKGEGMISLSRGFSYAGADCIVPTLWRVHDAKANQLMQFFYKNLQKKMPKDKALQQAKLSYLKNNHDIAAHPFYWSPFIIIGKNGPVNFPAKGITPEQIGLLISGIAILLLSGYLFLEYKKKKIN